MMDNLIDYEMYVRHLFNKSDKWFLELEDILNDENDPERVQKAVQLVKNYSLTPLDIAWFISFNPSCSFIGDEFNIWDKVAVADRHELYFLCDKGEFFYPIFKEKGLLDKLKLSVWVDLLIDSTTWFSNELKQSFYKDCISHKVIEQLDLELWLRLLKEGCDVFYQQFTHWDKLSADDWLSLFDCNIDIYFNVFKNHNYDWGMFSKKQWKALLLSKYDAYPVSDLLFAVCPYNDIVTEVHEQWEKQLNDEMASELVYEEELSK